MLKIIILVMALFILIIIASALSIFLENFIFLYMIFGAIILSLIIYMISRILIILGIKSPYSKIKFAKITNKKVSNEFKKMYNSIIKEYANGLEVKRRKLIVCMILLIVIAIASFILIIYLSKDIVTTRNNAKKFSFILIPLALFYVYFYKKNYKEYIKEYKDTFIKNFINNINSKLNYDKNGGQDLYNYYLDGEYEDKKFNDFCTDDYISCYNEDGTSIDICDVALKNKDEKGNYINTVYEGLFSVSFFNISIPNEVRIKKNQVKTKNNRVEMDSKEFEKYFDVYSDSNILAMEILTHDIMQEIIDFYNLYKIDFEMLLKRNKMYIRFNTGSMFEPNILKKSSNIKSLWVFYNVINFVTTFTIRMNKLLKDLEI